MSKQFQEDDFKISTLCKTQCCHLCVSVAFNDDQVAVRNMEDPEKTLLFNKEEWKVFVQSVKQGEFDC